MNTYLPITKTQIHSLFPYHMILDSNLTIVSTGKSLEKLLPGLNNQPLTENFTFHRNHLAPQDFTSLKLLVDENLFLRNKKDERIIFRYQIINLAEQERLLLAGTLCISEIELLSELNLKLSDFAPHDTITDMLQVLKGKEIVNEEMKKMLFTNQRQKKEIQKFKDNLITIINNIPTALLVEDENRKIVYTNVKFCQLFNIPFSPEKLIGMDCSLAAEQSKSLFENEDYFLNRINVLLKNNEKNEAEILNMKNGIILERDFIPLISENKKTGIIWQYKDITQQKNANLILKQNEEKYRGLVENLKLGLLEVDLNEKITKVYSSFCEMTGYSEEELLNSQVLKLLIVDDDIKKLESESLKRLSGLNSVYEVRIRKKDGQIIWVIISGAPLYNINNEVIGSIGIHWDITWQKKREEELKIAKELAEKSSLAKKSFMAKMSHELRTPLNVIQGMAELLKSTELNKEQKDDIQTISDSSSHLLNLVNDLLDIAKIESGKLTLLNKIFSMKELILECSTNHYHLAKEKGLHLNLKLHPTASVDAIGDKVKIKQIITNLLSNAIKFTEKGEVNFEVSYANDNFEILISDTGIGIPFEKQKIIFDQFTQATEETSLKYGGTGLGLSITKELTEMMGGHIEMLSKPGTGTKFLIKLPLKIMEEIKQLPEIEKSNKEKLDSLKNKRILVAEDNLLNQKLIQKILLKWKCEFDIVENGIEVLSMLENKKYDILLLDVLMPEMDGIITIKKIRQSKENRIRQMPVIGLTAQGSVEEKNNCLNAGMNSFVNKPFNIEKLKEEILFQLNADKDFKYIDLGFFKENGIKESEIINELIKTYLKSSSVTISKIISALKENNLPNIKLEIHSLKSNSKLFGIIKLSNLLEDLEHQTELDLGQTENLIYTIHKYYEESCIELEKFLNQQK